VQRCAVELYADHLRQWLRARWQRGLIGYFQFGGSTHCLVFRPGVISEFALQAVPQGENGENSSLVKVNSLLAMSR
jgi:hypothetical protein